MTKRFLYPLMVIFTIIGIALFIAPTLIVMITFMKLGCTEVELAYSGAITFWLTIVFIRITDDPAETLLEMIAALLG